MLPRLFRVLRNEPETRDSFTIELAPDDGQGGLRFRPGQFNMLYVFGCGEAAISLSGDPEDDERCVHTIRSVGSVTRALRQARPGEGVGLRGPFGNGWPMERAGGLDLVVIAGGIGFAPLRPVLYRVAAERWDYGRVSLLYGCRTPEDVLFRDELRDWPSRHQIDVRVTVDWATSGWPGRIGAVPALIQGAPFDPGRAVALICGPEIMARFAVLELRKRGVAAERIHVSMERNMKCAVALCGRCQYGPRFICRDGPVFAYERIRDVFDLQEV
jgi:NAD(P)H-flavin reductase